MKNQKIIIISVTTLLILGIGFLLIWPVISSIWSSWEEYAKAKNDLKIITEKKQILDELGKNSSIKNVSEIAQNYIPQEPESGQLVIELTAMATANNLKVEETSLEKQKGSSSSNEDTAQTSPTPAPSGSGTTDTTGGAKTVDFALKTSGSFNDFLNFLRTIETSSRLITIKNITMQQKIGTDKAVSFTAQISGAAYYKKDPSITANNDNLKVSEATLVKFLNLKTYGQPINLPSESGFGRANPFENY